LELIHRGIGLLLAVIILLLACNAALAAPDRFDNQIRDAVPDPENTYNFSLTHNIVNTEGPVTSESSSHQLLRFGYQFSDKLNASFHFGSHDLSGGLGLTNPIFSNLDSAKSYGLQLDMNLLNEPAIPAGDQEGSIWTPGSAFSIGFLGNVHQLDRSGIGESETELGAYLAYSTDLTEEMRGHTYFSTSRLTGDNASGSANRVGAGLDYLLMDGDKPLVLMANGIIDIYNFRQPQFNTSRISRFDLGLRYKMSREWDAQLGWSTFNDSEQDSSGSGIFAGLNWRSIKDPCKCGTCSICSSEQADESQAPDAQINEPQINIDAAMQAAAANLSWDPADTPVMDLSYPENYNRANVEQGLHGNSGNEAYLAEVEAAQADVVLPITETSGNDGIVIPLFPEDTERQAASTDEPDTDPAEKPAAGQLNPELSASDLIEPDPAESYEPTSEPDNAVELQTFIPLPTPATAHLSRAPAILAASTGAAGVTDACSRFLFLRLAGLPRQLLAASGTD
jgi:hypothetical protein